MSELAKKLLDINLSNSEERRHLHAVGMQRRWWLALMLIGWLHLIAFLSCFYLSTFADYHDAPGYLSIWIGEIVLALLILRVCTGPRSEEIPRPPLEVLIRRIWLAYFLLAFNLASMNTLRGHRLFELFPAMTSLASFGFIMMAIVIHWRFIGATVLMFASGLLMAANLRYGYLIFAIVWCIVLNGIGFSLWWNYRSSVSVRETLSTDAA